MKKKKLIWETIDFTTPRKGKIGTKIDKLSDVVLDAEKRLKEALKLGLKPFGEDREFDNRDLEYFLKKFIQYPNHRSREQLLTMIFNYDLLYSKQSLLESGSKEKIEF